MRCSGVCASALIFESGSLRFSSSKKISRTPKIDCASPLSVQGWQQGWHPGCALLCAWRMRARARGLAGTATLRWGLKNSGGASTGVCDIDKCSTWRPGTWQVQQCAGVLARVPTRAGACSGAHACFLWLPVGTWWDPGHRSRAHKPSSRPQAPSRRTSAHACAHCTQCACQHHYTDSTLI